MSRINDLSHSFTAFEQDNTPVVVVEISLSSWLVAGILPGVARQPLKKFGPDEGALLALIHRWTDEASRAGSSITRVCVAYEAGRDGFWLARWLRAHDVETYVIHSASVSVSREHRRAKTDRLDTELLKRTLLGWLRGERGHCSMAAIPSIQEEDARRPSREREKLVGDDVGQFQIGRHALCWVYAERLVHKLDTFTDQHRAAQQHVRSLIWWFYADLKAYRRDPTPARKAALRTRFDRIFKRRTGFATLDRLLARLHANKKELLMVLERPEIPLHTNGSENDIRCQVTKRKVSGGTRSDAGRDCRDALLGLAKTCAKLGISFWDYLGDRLAVAGNATIPYLPEIVSPKA